MFFLCRWFINLFHSFWLHKSRCRQLFHKLILDISYICTFSQFILIIIIRMILCLLVFVHVNHLRRLNLFDVNRLILLFWFVFVEVARDCLLHRHLLASTRQLHSTSIGAGNWTERNGCVSILIWKIQKLEGWRKFRQRQQILLALD